MQRSGTGDAPLLSIVIPTRERGEFVSSAVHSALACQDPQIEVVVSDNASTDDTKSVISSISDKRLVYANTGTRMPMHDNFAFALSRAQGRYLMFVGDDDAVLPARLARLLEILRSETPEVVNWHTPHYVWPGASNGELGLLTLKPLHLRGGKTVLSARALLQDLLRGSRAAYHMIGAKIYHGCVARDVVDRVVERAGGYFFVPWPDIGAAIANLFVVNEIVFLGLPCTLGGESRASNGRSQGFQETHARRPDNPYATFIQENTQGTNTGIADARVRPGAALTFFTLIESIRRMGASDLSANERAWLPLIESELAVLPEPARSEQADLIDFGLETLGLRLDRRWSEKAKAKRARQHPPMRRSLFLPYRMCIASQAGRCSNAFEAASLTDLVLEDSSDAHRRQALDLASAWIRALGRAMAATRTGRRENSHPAAAQNATAGRIF